MSPSLQEVNLASAQANAGEDGDILGCHLHARAAQRRVLLQCSLIGLIGVVILVAIIAGHGSDTAVAVLQN